MFRKLKMKTKSLLSTVKKNRLSKTSYGSQRESEFANIVTYWLKYRMENTVVTRNEIISSY